VKNQISKFELTKKQLDKKVTANTDLIEEYSIRCKEKQIDINDTVKELQDFNKKNLQKTYLLEDLLDQIEALKNERQLFLTNNEKIGKSLHKQQSYATLEKQKGDR